MNYRKLRIAWSAACGIACIVFIVLWVRTAYFCETIYGPLTSTSSLVITSRQGGLGIGLTKSAAPKWTYSANPPEVVPHRTYVTLLGFGYSNPANEGVFLRVLYPILIAGIIAFSIVPWFHWTARFSYVGACQVRMSFYMLALR